VCVCVCVCVGQTCMCTRDLWDKVLPVVGPLVLENVD